ncbi:MAG: acyl-CoA desaturase [Cyclobacteriaceae bacterium]
MSANHVKFNAHDRPEFFNELRSRVNQHFKDNNISRYGNLNMKLKTVFMLTLYFAPLVLMVTGVVSSAWGVIGMWALMGLGMSGIGLSIMHDANHGSYSKNQKVNNIMGYLLNFIGGYHVNWKIQHNVLHHSYTNVHGHDEDIDKGIMRFSPDQDHKPGYHFQAFYAPFLYGLMTIYWCLAKDYIQIDRYKKKNLLKGQGLTYGKAMIYNTINKIWYFSLLLVLPIQTVAVPWGIIVLGFLVMHFICGLTLALIFQPAHVIEETNFYVPDSSGSVENNWAIHQMRTTANFANGSTLFSWFIGGLNFQVEHHLFPNICHVHYKDISQIVKDTAHEFDVPYYEHRTFYGALKSHFTLLNQLGTNTYEKKLATA